MERVYLDYAATTPLDDRVFIKMMPWFKQDFGNPSSVHYFGQQAEAAVENARKMIAGCVGAEPEEVIFTSGGTESDNFALRGAALRERENRGANEILISPVEHHAIKTTAEQLRDHFGFEVTYIDVDEYGMIDLRDLEQKINPNTAVVSAIYANNEIGTINPINEIGKICHQQCIPFHSDGVQAVAHLDIDLKRDKVDLFSLGAHKFYGPKGIGALVVRQGYSLIPMVTGGKQEENRRAGTHNVPSIVGMAAALKQVQDDRLMECQRLTILRDTLINEVLQSVPGSKLTGHPRMRLPNHASFVFEKVNGNQLLILLDMAGFACSSGSACKIGDPSPSDVLLAIGLDPITALGSLRVTLGRETTKRQVDQFLQTLPSVVERARKLG